MSDTYTGNLSVEASAELNPYLRQLDIVFCGDAEGPFTESCEATKSSHRLCTEETPQTPPSIPYARTALLGKYIVSYISNNGDEVIEACLVVKMDGGIWHHIGNYTISPGEGYRRYVVMPSGHLDPGVHNISWVVKARLPGTTIWLPYYSDSITYTIQEPCTVTCALDDCPNTLGITTGCDLLKHYDTDGDGNISVDEFTVVINDYLGENTTLEEFLFVQDCYENSAYPGIETKCPGCYIPPCTVTCALDDCPNTLGITTGCDLLLHYDADGDGIISIEEAEEATRDHFEGIISEKEVSFVWAVMYFEEEINIKCPGCYIPSDPNGDITSVTLDGKLLPEGDTLDWILNDDAHVKVFFRNTGNVSDAFRIWLTDESGSILTGCDATTGSIPADGEIYYVDLCIFLPDIVKVKTLTAHITP